MTDARRNQIIANLRTAREYLARAEDSLANGDDEDALLWMVDASETVSAQGRYFSKVKQ